MLLLATMNSSLAARMIKHLSQILTTLFISLPNVGSKSRQVSCKCFKLSSHFDKILHTFQKKMMTTVWFILTRKLNFGGRQFAGPALYSGECQNNQTLGAAKTAACHIFHTNPFYRLHRAPQYICSTAIHNTTQSHGLVKNQFGFESTLSLLLHHCLVFTKYSIWEILRRAAFDQCSKNAYYCVTK